MKETFYFTHDYNARSDPKVKRLLQRQGMSGYGIFWALVEDLYQNGNTLPLDYESYAYDFRVDTSVVKSVLHDFDLFRIDGDYFHSESIQRRMDERNEKSEKAKSAAQRRWKNTSASNANALQTHEKSMRTHTEIDANALQTHANSMQTQCETDANAMHPQCDRNAIKERKGKEKKEKEITTTTEEDLNARGSFSDLPESVIENRKKAEEVARSEITAEKLTAKLLENETCRLAAKNAGVSAPDYPQAVEKFVEDKYGLEENKKWADMTDALKHFRSWLAFYPQIKNPHGKSSYVRTTQKTGRDIVERPASDSGRVEEGDDGVLRRISGNGIQTFAG